MYVNAADGIIYVRDCITLQQLIALVNMFCFIEYANNDMFNKLCSMTKSKSLCISMQNVPRQFVTMYIPQYYVHLNICLGIKKY